MSSCLYLIVVVVCSIDYKVDIIIDLLTKRRLHPVKDFMAARKSVIYSKPTADES